MAVVVHSLQSFVDVMPGDKVTNVDKVMSRCSGVLCWIADAFGVSESIGG